MTEKQLPGLSTCTLPAALTGLVCPQCHRPLGLESLDNRDGILYCEHSHWYPVLDRIPVMEGSRPPGELMESFLALHAPVLSRLGLAAPRMEEEGYLAFTDNQAQAGKDRGPLAVKLTSAAWLALLSILSAMLPVTAHSARPAGASGPDPVLADTIASRLADCFHYVPEMAFHKGLELMRLASLPLVPPLLDLGQGSGMVGGALAAALGITIDHGLDLVYDACRYAVDRVGSYGCVIAGSAGAMPYPDQSIGTIFSICVVEHIPDLEGVLSECARVLRPGGRLLLTVPGEDYLSWLPVVRLYRMLGLEQQARANCKWRDEQAYHFHYPDPQRWREMFASHGMLLERADPFFRPGLMALYDLMNWPALARIPIYGPLQVRADSDHRLRNRLAAQTCRLTRAVMELDAAYNGPATHRLVVAVKPDPGNSSSSEENKKQEVIRHG